MKFIPQIFGILAMAFLFLIYQQKKRKNMLIFKLSADVCWAIHYLCLGGIAGMIPNAVGIFRIIRIMNLPCPTQFQESIYALQGLL